MRRYTVDLQVGEQEETRTFITLRDDADCGSEEAVEALLVKRGFTVFSVTDMGEIGDE